jgi:hypothetical protein
MALEVQAAWSLSDDEGCKQQGDAVDGDENAQGNEDAADYAWGLYAKRQDGGSCKLKYPANGGPPIGNL